FVLLDARVLVTLMDEPQRFGVRVVHVGRRRVQDEPRALDARDDDRPARLRVLPEGVLSLNRERRRDAERRFVGLPQRIPAPERVYRFAERGAVDAGLQRRRDAPPELEAHYRAVVE